MDKNCDSKSRVYQSCRFTSDLFSMLLVAVPVVTQESIRVINQSPKLAGTLSH